MAFLFVDSLNENSRCSQIVQKSLKALEVLLLSAGLISSLVMVKSALLLSSSCTQIIFSTLIMGTWNSINSLLSSHLYIYIIINFMVLLIAASSSTFHHHHCQTQNPPPPPPTDAASATSTNNTCISTFNYQSSSTYLDHSNNSPNISTLSTSPPPPPALSDLISEAGAHEIKKTLYPLNKDDKENISYDDDDDDDKENDDDEEDTMESTWRSITTGGGRNKQRPKKAKQLKKCETWDVPHRPPQNNNNISSSSSARHQRRLDESEPSSTDDPKWKELRKSETFNDTMSITCRGGLRRDPNNWKSLEEFNKQVEAFIKKFNDNIKLQRQESDQMFLDMMKRGL